MKRFIPLFFTVLLFLLPLSHAHAQNQPVNQTFFVGKVTEALGDPKSLGNGMRQSNVEVSFEESGKTVTKPLSFSYREVNRKNLELKNGDMVLIMKSQSPGGQAEYGIYDRYRLNWLYAFIAFFAVLVLIMTRKRGLGALTGLVISFAVIVFFIVPLILAGHDPLLITILGSLVIMITTIYLAHGFSQRTTIAITGTFLALVITGVLAITMVSLLKLAGMGSEDAMLLQGMKQAINLQGLLLAGIIIGTLGVLDDTTTTQAATVFELAQANTKLTVKQLIARGFNVGREHITSLVNTLVLAYAGASLPLFIFFVLNPLGQPIWVILNNEMIVEEIVRTLAGSIGLIAAVPITTILAAFFSKYSLKIK